MSDNNVKVVSLVVRCLFCIKVLEEVNKCSRCRTATYCDRECQRKHWKVHKNSCQDSNNNEDSNEKLRMKAENNFNQGSYNKAEKLYLKLLGNLSDSEEKDFSLITHAMINLGTCYESQGTNHNITNY